MKYITILTIVLVTSYSLRSQSLIKKANKFFDLKQYDEAILSYQKNLEKFPADILGPAQIAEAHFRTANYEEALRWWDKIINTEAVNSTMMTHYVMSLQSLGRLDEGKIWSKILVKMDSTAGNDWYRTCERPQVIRLTSPTVEVKSEYTNTPSRDFAPSFNNNKVLWSVPVSGKSGKQMELLSSDADQNGFLKPGAPYHPALQKQFNDVPLSFTPDGRTVIFTKGEWLENHRPLSDNARNLTLYSATVNDQGKWVNIQKLPFNGNYNCTWPLLADFGQKLYFSSDKPGGKGGFDIYVSQKFGETWSVPASVGEGINSAYDEISPSLLGQFLYYSSNGPGGWGGFDVCQAQRIDGKWENGKVLDNGVNSTYDDYALTWDLVRNLGYMVSNRADGKGLDDIYRVRYVSQPFTVQIKDKKGEPISGAIFDGRKCGLQLLNSDINGQIKFSQLPKPECICKISLEKHIDQELSLQRNEVVFGGNVDVILEKANIKVKINATDNSTGKLMPDADFVLNASPANSEFKSINAVGSITTELPRKLSYFVKCTSKGFLPEAKLIQLKDVESDDFTLNIDMTPSTFSAKKADVVSDEPQKVVPTASEQSGEYALQLGAIVASNPPSLNAYQALLPQKTFYTLTENNITKIRVGFYDTKEQAVAALTELEKTKGVKGFVVRDAKNAPKKKESKTTEAPNSVEKAELKAAPVIADTKSITASKPKEILPPPADNFRVRIAAVRTIHEEELTKLGLFGTVITEPRGAFTAIFLGYFAEKSEASTCLKKVLAEGYKDAYVAKKRGKDWVK